MIPVPCHYCNMFVSRDREGRAVATHPAIAEPWTCPANPSGNHLIAAGTADKGSAQGALAAVREYRIYVDEDGEQVILTGPCAETIGCLFSRAYDSPTLGQLIDAATEHNGEQGERAHAHVAGMAADWDRAAGEYNKEHGHG